MGNGKGVIGANRFTPFYFFTLLSAYVTPAMSEVLGSLFRMYGFERHFDPLEVFITECQFVKENDQDDACEEAEKKFFGSL